MAQHLAHQVVSSLGAPDTGHAAEPHGILQYVRATAGFQLRKTGLAIVALTGTAALSTFGSVSLGGASSIAPTRAPIASMASTQTIVWQGLRLSIPSKWIVGSGVCRCGWGPPGSAILNNGPENSTPLCSCPPELTDSPSAIHLYAGLGRLSGIGRVVYEHGIRALVDYDRRTARFRIEVPSKNLWISMSPAPASKRASTVAYQASLERQIFLSIKNAKSGLS